MNLRGVVRRRFSVDARALAAFRVALGAIVVLDLLLRSRSLVAFYTDAGVLPRETLLDLHPIVARFSLHVLSGAAWFQWLLFGVTATAALSLVVGYRSRLATFVTGVLVVSLQVRNPLVLNGGDVVLQMLFLWGLLLPLGERWSVDALRDGEPRAQITSLATAGVLLQVVIIYGTNAVMKFRGDTWGSGEAIHYVFSLEMFVVYLGDVLANYPALLELFDTAWLVLLAGSFLLVVATGWARAALAAAYATMHLGMLLTMQLGVFPLISIAALLPFVPGVVWDSLPGANRVPGIRELPIERWQARIRSTLPLVSLPALPQSVHYWGRRTLTVALAVFIAFQLAYNAASVGLAPVPEAGPLDGEQPDPRWNMFAPNPLTTDYWLKAPATTASGNRVDAFHGGQFEWGKPPDVANSYPSARWRKYTTNVAQADTDAVPEALAGYLCTRWERRHDSRLANVTVYVVEQYSRLEGPEPIERVRLATHRCRGQ